MERPSLLQTKIVLRIFFKIQSFWFTGDALAWIIPELAAGVLSGHNTALLTKDLGIINDGTTGAVGAGAGVFFAE